MQHRVPPFGAPHAGVRHAQEMHVDDGNIPRCPDFNDIVVSLHRQEDAALRQLRFQLVPRRVSEEQFWQRYFAAVAALRRAILGSAAAASAEAHSTGGGAAMSERSASTTAHGFSVTAAGTPGEQRPAAVIACRVVLDQCHINTLVVRRQPD